MQKTSGWAATHTARINSAAEKLGIAVIAVGAVLILSALFLLLHNRYEDARAGQQAEDALASVEAAIATQPAETTAQTATEETQTVPTEPPLDPEMPTVVLNGYAYVGYLELPTLELKLPRRIQIWRSR